ncbi:hypothetical protein ACTSKR_12890 [Chitinibacteraceae bacterium HSL-7]
MPMIATRPLQRLGAALLTLSLLAGCQTSADMEGHWEADAAAMVQRAQAMGASEQELSELGCRYQGAMLEVTADALVLRIRGISDQLTQPYERKDDLDGCAQLEIALNGQQQRGRFCLVDGTLEVHDLAGPKAVEIYRRAS